jgi:formylmethanofuran:tetrahydromethanopterin formyltransferase
MSSEHDPDLNPTLDEIESAAAVAARFWLSEAESVIEDEIADPKRHPAGMIGFVIAAAIQYHAERQIDAAERIGNALELLAKAVHRGE